MRAEAGFIGRHTRLENLVHRLEAHRRTQRLLFFTSAPRSLFAGESLLPRGLLALKTQLLLDAGLLLLRAPIACLAALALVVFAAPRFVETPALLGVARRLRLLRGAPLLRLLHFALKEACELLLLARHLRREELGLAGGLAPGVLVAETQVALEELSLRLDAHRLALLVVDEPLAVPMLGPGTLVGAMRP